jgi:hypothetical protein
MNASLCFSNDSICQPRCDRVVRKEVDFTFGYHCVADYLVSYLRQVGHPGVNERSQVNRGNIATFISKYVKAPFMKTKKLTMIQAKPCINHEGWEELMKIAEIKVEESGVVKLLKKRK